MGLINFAEFIYVCLDGELIGLFVSFEGLSSIILMIS